MADRTEEHWTGMLAVAETNEEQEAGSEKVDSKLEPDEEVHCEREVVGRALSDGDVEESWCGKEVVA